MELPTHGGRWLRNPKTGALKADPPPADPVPADVVPEQPADTTVKPKDK